MDKMQLFLGTILFKQVKDKVEKLMVVSMSPETIKCDPLFSSSDDKEFCYQNRMVRVIDENENVYDVNEKILKEYYNVLTPITIFDIQVARTPSSSIIMNTMTQEMVVFGTDVTKENILESEIIQDYLVGPGEVLDENEVDHIMSNNLCYLLDTEYYVVVDVLQDVNSFKHSSTRDTIADESIWRTSVDGKLIEIFSDYNRNDFTIEDGNTTESFSSMDIEDVVESTQICFYRHDSVENKIKLIQKYYSKEMSGTMFIPFDDDIQDERLEVFKDGETVKLRLNEVLIEEARAIHYSRNSIVEISHPFNRNLVDGNLIEEFSLSMNLDACHFNFTTIIAPNGTFIGKGKFVSEEEFD